MILRSHFLYRSGVRVLLLLASMLFLEACAETQLIVHSVKELSKITDFNDNEQTEDAATSGGIQDTSSALGEYKVGEPYEVAGVWYYPKINASYDEVGIASWYGQDFHGKRTANGAIYDMNALTAAHKTLPMPSKVRVTNLSNKRSLIVDINDRGPFVNGRIIDLSRRASQLLGFKKNGLAMVRVQAISENGAVYLAATYETPPVERNMIEAVPAVDVAVGTLPLPDGAVPSTHEDVNPVVIQSPVTRPLVENHIRTSPGTDFFVQVGAFLQEQNASTLSGRLSLFAPVRIIEAELDGSTYYRVRLGPVINADDADELMQTLITSGYKDIRLIME